MNRISFLNRGYAFKGLLAVNKKHIKIFPVKILIFTTKNMCVYLSV